MRRKIFGNLKNVRIEVGDKLSNKNVCVFGLDSFDLSVNADCRLWRLLKFLQSD